MSWSAAVARPTIENVTEVPSPQLRISDQTRESALSALGEHMSAGRLDIEEYGDRSARITAAKTRGELGDIFADLPAPHPKYDEPWQTVSAPAAPAPPPARAPASSNSPAQWAPAQRALAGILPLLFIAAIALIATHTVGWPIIFVPIGLAALGKGLWGHDWNHDERQRERRRLRDERRRELGH
jgi:hypothetical protein